MSAPSRWSSRLLLLAGAALLLAATVVSPSGAAPIRVGAVFPLGGPQAGAAAEERLGVEIARDLANADGGAGGRRIRLDIQDLEYTTDAGAAVDTLQRNGDGIVVGAYSSDLSMAASQAAADRGLVYWEAGAVADRVTGRGLPLVFRVGAAGSNLGGNSVWFAAGQLAARLGRPAGSLRISLVVADDLYARSVAAAAQQAAGAAGMRVVSVSFFSLLEQRFDRVLADLRAARPDILVLSSHVPDGVAFRRAFVAAGLHVDAFIGSTMAQCIPDFGRMLGPEAVGVFASDRPGDGFDPATLRPEGRSDYRRFAQLWAERHGGAPSEEGLSGFSAAWALFHDVLPLAASAGRVDAATVAAAARSLDLPPGTLPNAAGVRFSDNIATLGQNTRAAAVIWQWQGIDHSVVVWPPEYATGTVTMVPPPR